MFLTEVLQKIIEEVDYLYTEKIEKLELPTGEQSYLKLQVRRDLVSLGTRLDDFNIYPRNPYEVRKVLDSLIEVLEQSKNQDRVCVDVEGSPGSINEFCVQSKEKENYVFKIIRAKGQTDYTSTILRYLDDLPQNITSDLLSMLKRAKNDLIATFDLKGDEEEIDSET